MIYNIPKYEYSPGLFKFSLTVSVPGAGNQNLTEQIWFKIRESPLSVYIKGGNKMSAFSEPLLLSGVAKDIDLKPEFQEEGITFNWDCRNMADDLICYKRDKTALQFNTSLE